jgi:hypothetical protein
LVKEEHRMDLETLRAKLAEKQAAAERISNEETAARENLAVVAKAAKAAEGYAHEKALFAVINESPEAKAKAEEAKANLAAAFARETEIRDRLPLLAAARQKLNDEMEAVLRDIKVAGRDQARRGRAHGKPRPDRQRDRERDRAPPRVG